MLILPILRLDFYPFWSSEENCPPDKTFQVMASLLISFDEDKQRLSPHSNYGIPSSSGFGRLCFKNDCAKLQGKWGCWFWPSKMKVLSNNYHPDSIFGLFVGREMIIKNLSLTSRKKCIEKYNFEGDMMPFTWRVCAKIRGPPVSNESQTCIWIVKAVQFGPVYHNSLVIIK